MVMSTELPDVQSTPQVEQNAPVRRGEALCGWGAELR